MKCLKFQEYVKIYMTATHECHEYQNEDSCFPLFSLTF